jgi:O-antigen ligase
VLGRYSRTFVRLPLAIALSVLASELLRTRTHLKRAAAALIVAGALDAAYGLYFVARGTPLHPYRFSGMSDVNFAAMLIGTSAVTALALLARTPRFVRLIRPAALAALALATLSEMGVLALLAAWVTVLRRVVAHHHKVRIALICLLAVAVGLALAPIRERLLHRDDRQVQADGVARNSADVRWMILDTAWNAVRSRPILGLGYFRFLEYSNTNSAIRISTGGQGYPTHNTYLEVLVEGGIVAFTFFALHWVQYMKGWPRAVRAAARQRDPVLAAGVVGFPVVLVCAALANVMLVYSFWLVCGLTLSAINLQRREAWRARHLVLAPILR